MSADVKIAYADPGVSGNPGTATRQLAAQQVVNDNGDTVDVEVVSLAAEAIHSGKVTSTTPGTAVPLAGSATPCKHVTIQALGANSSGSGGNKGYVWVGGSGVLASSQNGIFLPQGSSYELDINDISKVFIDIEAGNSGDGVSFNYVL